MRIGIFLPNWVGDTCMVTPAIRAIRETYGSETEWIAIGRHAPCELLQGSRWFSEFLTYRPRGRPHALSRRDLVYQLRQRKLDQAILFTNSLSTACIAFLGGARQRIGFAGNGRTWLLTDSIAKSSRRSEVSTLDHYLLIAEYLGCTNIDRRMEIPLLEEDVELVRKLWSDFGWDEDAPTVVINSSGATSASRLWPESHVLHLLNDLLQIPPLQVLVHCGPKEKEAANRVSQKIGNPRVRSLGESTDPKCQHLPLGLSKGVLHRASVVVTTDSGPRHIALALNRPVLSLFGPTHPDWNRSYHAEEKRIYLGLPCQPCSKLQCPLVHQNCMKEIQPSRVAADVRALLGVENRTPSAPQLPDAA